jgi:hypothetical protein
MRTNKVHKRFVSIIPLLINDLDPAIKPIGVFIMAKRSGPFLPIAHRSGMSRVGPHEPNLSVDRQSTLFPQGEVIFSRTALIGVPFQRHYHVGMIGKMVDQGLDDVPELRPNLIPIIVEIDNPP